MFDMPASMVLGSVMYILSLSFACAVAGAWKRKGVAIALVWGVAYPVFQLLVAGPWDQAGHSQHMWMAFFYPTAITAGLLTWITRSPIPAAGCLIGFVLAGLRPEAWFTDHPTNLWRAMPWNVVVGVSLLIWAGREAKRIAALEGHCKVCGYDLRGTAGRVCPECGGASVGR
jgi:hypothetical protein